MIGLSKDWEKYQAVPQSLQIVRILSLELAVLLHLQVHIQPSLK